LCFKLSFFFVLILFFYCDGKQNYKEKKVKCWLATLLPYCCYAPYGSRFSIIVLLYIHPLNNLESLLRGN
ncbi:hypothetical protein VIGAN_02225200, partial [Vigna angularis var. angularis]